MGHLFYCRGYPLALHKTETKKKNLNPNFTSLKKVPLVFSINMVAHLVVKVWDW